MEEKALILFNTGILKLFCMHHIMGMYMKPTNASIID